MTSLHFNRRVHYQTSFRIKSTNKKNDLLSDIIKSIRHWIKEKENNDKGLLGSWFFSGGEWKNSTNSNTILRVNADCNGDGIFSTWSIFYQEADKSNPGIRFWYTDVGLKRIDAEAISFSIRISHALNRQFIGEEPPPPVASSPRLIRYIFSLKDTVVNSGDLVLRRHPIEIELGKAHVLKEVIFNTRRYCPIVFINGEYNENIFPVDPPRIQSLLLGKAQVYWASENDLLGEELSYLIPNNYRCSYLNVRVYLPITNSQRPNDYLRHRFFTSSQLQCNSAQNTINGIIGTISRVYQNFDPSGVLTIEDIENRKRTIALENFKAAGVPTNEWIAALEEEIDSLQNQKDDYESMLDDVANELNILRFEHDKLDAQLRSISCKSAGTNDKNDLDKLSFLKIHELNWKTATPLDCLNSLNFLYPERIIILDSAYTSAEESFGFLHVERLWNLLQMLTTDYYYAMCESNKGDSFAKNVFGNSFAAKESETVEKNHKLMSYRKFYYKGEQRLMNRHLKIGVKNSKSETIRVHFDWDNEKRCIVIGHCGEHLPLK